MGYSIEQFRRHLEGLFEPWMNWSNHGLWHVDHVIPVSFLVRAGITDPAAINALRNLRPMRAEKNLRKHARLDTDPAEVFPELFGARMTQPSLVSKVA
jgi:hypothetical protein